ncbi:hypothetical protein HZ326_23763 [Fusarium oxysporum f. sp. albedinis]|nr:hypothetical protein HZ326_23763 [Fusarium oxysporum f. sp. albedinis]
MGFGQGVPFSADDCKLCAVKNPHLAVVANGVYVRVECEIETQQVIQEERLKAGAVQGGGMLKERSQKNELEESQEREHM